MSNRPLEALTNHPGLAGHFRFLPLAMLAFLLAACQSANLGLDTENLREETAGLPQLTPNPKGEVFGNANVRVSLLIPKSAPGNAASVANEIRNGALLAMQDFGQDTLQLVIKDTKGQAAEAQQAATDAVSEGSSAVLGPLFSSSVTAASAITQPADRAMIAFSTDASVAKRGVYLLSYTPQADTRRMINYAIGQGRSNIHAFLPQNAEGTLREAVLRQIVGERGGNVTVTTYERSGPGIETAVAEAVATINSADAIYIPEGGQIPSIVLSGLSRAGAQIRGKLVLGSGQWESVKFGDPNLEGAVYTGRDVTNFVSFANRYEATYGNKPGVFAALGYDAVTLAATLIKSKGPEKAFSSAVIEDRRGYSGINGIFRFKADGTAERGLAIYQVTNGAGQPVSPAPTTFSGS